MMVKIFNPAPPVVLGLFDVPGDKLGAPCAACGDDGDYRMKRTLVMVDGVWLMLCIDPYVCRLRQGNTFVPGEGKPA